MGNFCSGQGHRQDDLFEYRYGEDDKEINIQHEDSIPCYSEPIRHNLNDCEMRLKDSRKRFKDVKLSSDPLKLVMDKRELHCHFERPEHFLKRDQALRQKIYRVVSRQNCRPSNICINDEVMQYFGVFLCYLADHPDIIESILLTGSNSYGIAAVNIVHQGKRRPMYIDDYILCYNDGPLFSQPIKSQDMWPCLLEKAWFKYKSALNTGIDKIHPLELFKTFLMFPMRPIFLDQSPEQNQRLADKHLITPFLNRETVGTVVTSRKLPEHQIGLTGRKHYYLMRVFDIDGKIYYYLRNPCGAFDFRGILQLKDIPGGLMERIIKVTGEYPPDGNFLLSQQQFWEQIETFFVVKYTPLAPVVTEFQIPFHRFQHEEVFIKFDIKKDQPIGMRLHQLNKIRGYDSITSLLLDVDRKVAVSGLHNEEGCFGQQQANLLTTDLQTMMPGSYLLRLKRKSGLKPKEQDSTKMILEAMLSEDILITNASQQMKFYMPLGSELKQLYHDILRSIASREMVDDALRDQNNDTEHIIVWLGDIVVIYIRKLNPGKVDANLEVNFPDLTNLECNTHKIGKGYNAVPPFKKDCLIIFEKINLTESTKLGEYSLAPY